MSSTNGTDSRMPRTTISRGNFGQTRLILNGAAVLLSLGMGMRQSLGLFLAPVTRDLALAADFTLAVAIQNIVWGVSQAPIGAIADRFGLRATMMAGAAIYVLGLGLGLMAASGGALSLFVSGGFIGVALSCTASSLALTACARAVSEERRSKMLGVVAAAGSLGTLLVPLITQSLLVHQTWQIGVLFFAILAAVMLPAAFWAGAADRLPGSGVAKATMREMLGEAARSTCQCN
jgi:MFS family permease